MFDFFGFITSKIISAIATMIIAVGIVSMPVVPEEAKIAPPQKKIQATTTDDSILTQEVEKARLEAETAKAKAEAEKYKLETERLRQESEIKNQIQTDTQPITQNDSLIRIEQCKADRDEFRAGLEIMVGPMVNKLTQEYSINLLNEMSAYSGIIKASDLNPIIAKYKSEKYVEIRNSFDKETLERYNSCLKK